MFLQGMLPQDPQGVGNINWYVPLSHLSPVHPGTHVQVYEVPPSFSQEPPLAHGFDEQGSRARREYIMKVSVIVITCTVSPDVCRRLPIILHNNRDVNTFSDDNNYCNHHVIIILPDTVRPSFFFPSSSSSPSSSSTSCSSPPPRPPAALLFHHHHYFH